MGAPVCRCDHSWPTVGQRDGSVLMGLSIMNNVNTSVGNTSVGEEEYTLYGKSTITEILRGLTFQISSNSFFQTNAHQSVPHSCYGHVIQAEVLYGLIEDCAGLRGDGSEIVLDLFCGTGTIGLTLARKAKHVYGYEVVPQAVSDARRNAEKNGISNATFIQGDLNKINDSFGNEFPKPDMIISDPNRPGMHMKLIKYLLKLRAPRIIYISCNPATCARDLDYLCHGSRYDGPTGLTAGVQLGLVLKLWKCELEFEGSGFNLARIEIESGFPAIFFACSPDPAAPFALHPCLPHHRRSLTSLFIVVRCPLLPPHPRSSFPLPVYCVALLIHSCVVPIPFPLPSPFCLPSINILLLSSSSCCPSAFCSGKMFSKKEERAQAAAAERIKAATLTAAKGLSRAQAEWAVAIAACNVNAYGQKEEGPSRLQEQKEAKWQMYLLSTENAIKLGERKDLKSLTSSYGGVVVQCQKCFETSHRTYECKNEWVYISRPSRTQFLENRNLKMKLAVSLPLPPSRKSGQRR
ncbi:hypothetical protein ACLOJK_014893 [Asimina triloba]